jgi:hypothetical protein
MMMAFVYASDVNLCLGCSITQYTKDAGDPEAYKNFSALPTLYSTARTGSLREFALEDASFHKYGTQYLSLHLLPRLSSSLTSPPPTHHFSSSIYSEIN